MKNLLLLFLILISAISANCQCIPGLISGINSVRVSDTATLNCSGRGGTWSISDTSIATINPTSGLILGKSRGTTNVSYTLSGACSTYFTIDTFKVTSGFIGHSKICIGDTTRLSDTLAIGRWSSMDTTIASINDTSGLLRALDTGNVIIKYTFSRSGSVYFATDTMHVKTIPNAGTVIGNLSVCPGVRTILVDTSGIMIWQSGDNFIARIDTTKHDTAWVVAFSTGTTNIKFTSNYCTLSHDTVNFTVYPLPIPGSIFPAHPLICYGYPITLTVSGSSGVTSHNWSCSSYGGSTIGSTGVMTGMGSTYGDYGWVYYDVFNAYGCSNTTVADYTVMGVPDLGTISGGTNIHLGESASYSSSGSGTMSTWTSSDVSRATITAGGLVTGVSTGTVNITHSLSNVCGTGYTNRTVNVVPPTVGASAIYFTSYINTSCSGTQFGVSVPAHTAPYRLMTVFGDDIRDTITVAADTISALTTFTHSYLTSGTYSIKQVLNSGSTALDSTAYSYQHFICRDIGISLFLDANGNSRYDSASEVLNSFPLSVEVDSNGVPLDTLSVTSGLYYTTWGSVGTVYSFKVCGIDSPLHISFPSSGILLDTLRSGSYSFSIKYIALTCGSTPGFDLWEKTFLIAGRHKANGNIFVSNGLCTPQNSVVTLQISPKYALNTSWTVPAPTSIVGNTVTWNLSGLSASSPLRAIAYTLQLPTDNSGWLTPGDTAHNIISISPMAGDADTSNNVIIRIDTVKSSFDPNHIDVYPEGNVLNGTKLTFNVEFENEGNDTAQNIYVMDTLSDNLNPHTLKLIGASAPMNIAFIQSGVHTIIKFDFPNIKLLDSSHHGKCSGNIMYTINTDTGLADGSRIYSHAGIYFDDNPVVLTDSAANTILIPHISVHSLRGDTVCLGDTVQFLAVPTSVNTTHYQWFINGLPVGRDTISLVTDSVGTGDTISCHMITIMDDTVRSVSNNVVMVYRGLPNAGTISGPTAVCPSRGIYLSETVSGGTWATTNSHATVSGGTTIGLSAGSDTVMYTTRNACGSSITTHLVVVNPLPYAGTITGPATVCLASTVTLSDSVTSGTWSARGGHTSHSGVAFIGVNVGTDTVFYTVSNYCGSATANRTIVVNPIVIPSVSMSVSPGDTLCEGDSVTFVPSPVNGGTVPTYLWQKFGLTVDTGATFQYVPGNGDAIRCVMVSSAICSAPDTVSTVAMTLMVRPVVTPTATVTTTLGDSAAYIGQDVTFYSEISYCGSTPTYQWHSNGVAVIGATASSFTASVVTDDTFYCIVNCNTPCAARLFDTSNIKIIYANYLTETFVSSPFLQSINIHPNPTNDKLIISGITRPVSYRLVNVAGACVQRGLFQQGSNAIELMEYAQGLYMLELTGEDGLRKTIMIVKE